MDVSALLFAFLAAGALCWALAPACMRLALKLDLVDRPSHRKIHERPVPYLGGAALFGGIFLTLLLTGIVMGSGPFSGEEGWGRARWILAATLWTMLAGLADDRWNLRARVKLFLQLLPALAFALFCQRFEVLQLPWMPALPLYYLSLPLTVFFILAVCNAFNLVDGMDGLCGSVAAAGLFLLAAAGALLGDPSACLLGLTGLGALLAFLHFNWRPARIYLGDAGSCGLGMFVATLLLSLGQGEPQAPALLPGAAAPFQPFPFQLPVALLFIAYPALDVCLAVLRRILRGRPVGSADKAHLHHRLLQQGWPPQAVAGMAAGFSLLCGAAALEILGGGRVSALKLLGVSGALLAVGLPALGCLDFLHPRRLRHARPHFVIANHFISMQSVKLELAQYLNEVLTLCNQCCIEFGVEHYEFCLPEPGGRGEWRYNWKKPEQWHRDYLTFFDTQEPQQLPGQGDEASLPGGAGRAAWTFEPHPVEEDIDVEYRVLLSEFMARALSRARDLCASYGEAQEASGVIAGGATVNSSLLKRRSAPQRLEWLSKLGY